MEYQSDYRPTTLIDLGRIIDYLCSSDSKSIFLTN